MNLPCFFLYETVKMSTKIVKIGLKQENARQILFMWFPIANYRVDYVLHKVNHIIQIVSNHPGNGGMGDTTSPKYSSKPRVLASWNPP